MPTNVFSNSSGKTENKIDSSSFVQKPYFRANFTESNIEDIDMKNEFEPKKLIMAPSTTEQAALKSYVHNKFNSPSVIRNNAHFDFNDKNLDNVLFFKVNSPLLSESI